jgi:hypothetical protein
MASKKTWIWVLVGFVGFGVVVLFALAGAGVYFVTRHIHAVHSSDASALEAFDTARAAFKDRPPLFELDRFDQPQATRDLSTLPTSPVKPTDLHILAWNPDDRRLVRITLPFWMLRLGRRKIDIIDGHHDFDVGSLDVSVDDLERIGPALVLDLRTSTGERVLVWTE